MVWNHLILGLGVFISAFICTVGLHLFIFVTVFSKVCAWYSHMQVYRNILLANEYQSSKLCEALYTKCEDLMDQLQVLRLPSMAKFNAGFLRCNQSFEKDCVGPSNEAYEKRMMKVRVPSFLFRYSHDLVIFPINSY